MFALNPHPNDPDYDERRDRLVQQDKEYHDWLLKADSELEVPCPMLAIGEPCQFGCEDEDE